MSAELTRIYDWQVNADFPYDWQEKQDFVDNSVEQIELPEHQIFNAANSQEPSNVIDLTRHPDFKQYPADQ
jgi:hypothetical protein